MLFALEYTLAQFGTLPVGYRETEEQICTQVAHERLEQERVLDAREPAGRRLDCPMQELKREANTLASNSQDAETTCAVALPPGPKVRFTAAAGTCKKTAASAQHQRRGDRHASVPLQSRNPNRVRAGRIAHRDAGRGVRRIG
jgi:hypothetical protein